MADVELSPKQVEKILYKRMNIYDKAAKSYVKGNLAKLIKHYNDIIALSTKIKDETTANYFNEQLKIFQSLKKSRASFKL